MRIFLGNLAFGTTEDEIKTWLHDGGYLATDIRIATVKETGQSRGFAFAECDDPRVIQDMDGQQLQGRRINVSEARARTEKREQPGRQRKGWAQQDNRHGSQD